MADYLETYARTFEFDVRSGVRVESLSRDGDRFVLMTRDRRYEADNVVVATGSHRVPKVPPFAGDLDPSIVQLHSSEYRRTFAAARRRCPARRRRQLRRRHRDGRRSRPPDVVVGP